MENNNKNNEYRGTSLFNDIEDTSLRNRNRAVILTNTLEDGFNKGKVSPRAAMFIMGYFNEIPQEDRQEVKDKFVQFAAERGFTLQ